MSAIKKRKGVSCLWIVALPLMVLLAVFVAEVVVPPPPPVLLPTPTAEIVVDVPAEPFAEEPYSTPEYLEDKPERIAFALLGGDWRDHRAGTDYGNKTDVSLIVVITMTDPVDILVIQLPRNLYVETSLGNYWQFAIYKQFGDEGYQLYLTDVFNLAVPVVAYIDMERFVPFVDDVLGGIWIKGVGIIDGEETLDYLRDNENNWSNCSYYDCEGRQFQVLEALAQKLKTKFAESPMYTAEALWPHRYLFETNIDDFQKMYYLVNAAWRVATSEYTIRFERLTQSGTIQYGDTPLEVRGWVESGNIYKWVEEVLNDQ